MVLWAVLGVRASLRMVAADSARFGIIALIAFLTLVDLFPAQAILPSLTAHYQVTPADMAVAVNASTLGMAISSLAVALYSSRIDRRKGILIALVVLAIPTSLLAHAGNLAVEGRESHLRKRFRDTLDRHRFAGDTMLLQ